MSKEIKLRLLVKDIKNYHYLPHAEEPLTLALIRAKHPNLIDTGMGLLDKNTNKWLQPKQIKNYITLQRQLWDAYALMGDLPKDMKTIKPINITIVI